MARPKNPVPAYKHHKPTNTAHCWVNGQWVSLGRWDSPESRQAHARICAELAAAPTPAVVSHPGASPTVDQILLAFWTHAQQHYRRPDGTLTNEQKEYRLAFVPLRELYGPTPAAEFGPLGLKAVRRKMVDSGLCRTTLNNRVRRLKHVFKWAASEQLVPVATYQALVTVGGLQKGRGPAPEPDLIGPVGDAAVRATLPFVRPSVRAMVELQLLTGMRPGEVARLRPADIDTLGPVWVYRPPYHKLSHKGKSRLVAIGPRAQAVLRPFTPADPSAYYFNPRLEVERLHAERTRRRKTPRYPSHLARNAAKRVAEWKRPPAGRYSSHSYAVAITRAVRRANARRGRMAGAGHFDPVPEWVPNQLRHAHATRVRKARGLEAAGAALGHDRLTTTLIYAEKNLELAVAVAAELG
jgi:integrase